MCKFSIIFNLFKRQFCLLLLEHYINLYSIVPSPNIPVYKPDLPPVPGCTSILFHLLYLPPTFFKFYFFIWNHSYLNNNIHLKNWHKIFNCWRTSYLGNLSKSDYQNLIKPLIKLFSIFFSQRMYKKLKFTELSDFFIHIITRRHTKKSDNNQVFLSEWKIMRRLVFLARQRWSAYRIPKIKYFYQSVNIFNPLN